MTADEMRALAARIKKIAADPEVVAFCNAVLEFLGARKIKSAAEKKRDRNKYQRDYMRKYRKRETPQPRKDEDMGDFGD